MATQRSKSRSSRSRQRRFESLEPKTMMAGDVLVSVVEGVLVVHGDELDNQIAITAGPEPGTYAVHGLEGTNVILQPPPADPVEAGEVPSSTVVVHGVHAGARIGMGDGSDKVVIRDAVFHGNVGIMMGLGDDEVVVGPVRPPEDPAPDPTAESAEEVPPPEMAPGRPVVIGGNLAIATGEGDDRVHVGRAVIRGALEIATDGDDDRVLLGVPPQEPMSEDPEVATAEVAPMPAEGPAALRVVRGIHVNLGEGDDSLVVNHVGSAAGLHVNGGLGNDQIGVHASRFGRLLELIGGDGDGLDNIVLGHVAANLTSIHTGSGADHVRIVDSLFRQLSVALGDGDDTLALEGNTAQVATLLGGDGEDTLLGLRNNRFRRHLVRGFELPVVDDTIGAI